MRRAKGRQRGITIIELMVATVCLGFIAAPVLGCIGMIRTNIAEARVQASVAALLRNSLSTLMVGGQTITLISGTSLTSSQTIAGGTTVTITTQVNSVSGYSKLFRLTATATWSAAYTNGRSDTLTLEAYDISPNT